MIKKLCVGAAMALMSVMSVPSAAVAQAPVEAPHLYAGDPIFVHYLRADGTPDSGRCSVNSIHVDGQGRSVAVTAGHCLDGMMGQIHGVTTESGVPLATNLNDTTRWAVPQRAGVHIPGNSDSGAFVLDPHVIAVADQVRSTGAGGWMQAQITGSTGIPFPQQVAPPAPFDAAPLPLDQVRLGEPFCKDGSVSGRTCGVVVHVDHVAGEVTAALVSGPGDSGGAGYVFRDGVARNVGILAASKLGALTVFVTPERAHALMPR